VVKQSLDTTGLRRSAFDDRIKHYEHTVFVPRLARIR
jgi:hypothetical protein